ncbi:MAG TPA: VOC family protein [Paucimonas sp.]|nr:VOC family protein [Paucimonas sp.]
MQRVGRLVILVRDYGEAIAFYCGKLGFEIFVDIEAGERRYVHVRLPSQPDFCLWLLKAESVEDDGHVGRQAGRQPLAVIYTDGIAEDYRRLRDNGIVFHVPLQEEPGAAFAHFRDLYGNEFVLCELREA